MKMVILGSVPSKKNSRINTRSGRSFPSKNYSAWNALAIQQMQEQFKGFQVTSYPITLKMVFYWKDKRRHDIDNSIASIQDTLKDAGVIEDDNFNFINKVVGEFGGTDKDNPRCEIELI